MAFNAGQFTAFEVGEHKSNAQPALATAAEDVNFQSAFDVVKGSAPANSMVSSTEIRR